MAENQNEKQKIRRTIVLFNSKVKKGTIEYDNLEWALEGIMDKFDIDKSDLFMLLDDEVWIKDHPIILKELKYRLTEQLSDIYYLEEGKERDRNLAAAQRIIKKISGVVYGPSS